MGGSPRCGKVLSAHLLANENFQVVFEKSIKELEDLGVNDAYYRFAQSIRDLSFSSQELSDSLLKLSEAIKQNPIVPDPEPSKYFSKPKNNFKRR